jgi:DNA polymerase-1
MDRILLIDGMNMFIRSFAALNLSDENGNHIGGMYGCMQSIKSICETFHPSKIVWCWEGRGAAKKRRETLAEYKVGRDVKRSLNRQFQWETPESEWISFKAQIFRLKEYLETMPIYQVEVDQLEADDIIAYICNKKWLEGEKIVISSDRDYFQLITDKVLVYRPIKRELIDFGHMLTEYKVFPTNWIITKILMGDNSDGVKGIKGLGLKTINKLFPFLIEHRRINLNEIVEFSQKNVSGSKHYKSIVDEKDRLQKNWEVMQLLDHNFSIAGMDVLNEALNQHPIFKPFQLRLLFMQDNAGKQLQYFDSWASIFTPLNYH